MLRFPLIAAVSLSAMAATLSSAQDDAPMAAVRDFTPVNDIEWRYVVRGQDGGDPLLQFARDGMNSTIGAESLPEAAASLASVASAAPGQPVSFAVRREAGLLACTGSVTVRGRAGGTCRFDPDRDFVAALAARGFAPAGDGELLGLAFVGARLASLDELAHAGFPITSVEELTTVAALEVTGAYATELRTMGLEPEDLDALVSAKAVGVESGWISEMAEAGYPGLDLDKAIELRALGVTADYARRMARVMRAMEGVE